MEENIVCNISYNKPINIDEWNALCESNGNLLCSTFYDKVQAHYNQKSIYFHFYNNEELLAGVKLYQWESRKIPFILPLISKRLSQFGEYVLKPNINENDILHAIITREVKNFIKKSKAVSFTSGGFYGQENLILNPYNQKPKIEFDVAYIDLTKSMDELKANMHPKHKNMLNKSAKSNLIFIKNVEIKILIKMLDETYKNQVKSGPSHEFIENLSKHLTNEGKAKIFAVNDEYGKTLSVALVCICGNTADYTFGGNIHNSLGAGQFLQWNIFEYLKTIGVKQYSLGQIAKSDVVYNNPKFEEGISRFKSRFGIERKNCFKQKTILNKFKYFLFNKLLILTKIK